MPDARRNKRGRTGRQPQCAEARRLFGRDNSSRTIPESGGEDCRQSGLVPFPDHRREPERPIHGRAVGLDSVASDCSSPGGLDPGFPYAFRTERGDGR